ncbi:AsmA family protein [Neoroseomonas soli]|uniref:AsmA family protein n=1 Tax=Neoroseomonas soli TaxID=1081025 RepID=A0A9X9X259_9PROT|nr:AsmA family protein [Neoroseomonas soli]
MRKRLLLVLLPVAVLVAAWVGPRLLDWEAQRDRVAAIASARLGRHVTLEGPLSLTLLPQPMVEAASVRVGEAEGAEIGISARALHLRLGLLPLLLGRFEPRDLVLVGADIRLPWPPDSIGAVRPPPWLTGFDARIENSRVAVGGAVLEGVAARLAAPGPLDAIRTEGSFTWRGAPVRFEAVIGRPGFDGVATLDIVMAAQGATATARGVLVAEGGFDGRIEASGADLSALTAAPAGPFRATGRLGITAEIAAADDLALDLGGVTGRGAATFRFAPAPSLDIALALARLDLDAWITALRGAQQPPLPVGLDLSAEVAAFRGQTLRRLRGGVLRENGRLTLSGLSAVLPGEAQVEGEGAIAGPRLELAVRFAGPSLRTTIAAFGAPVDRFDPARLRAFEGQARLELDQAQLGVQDLAAVIDGARASGAGVLRFGARPALGLGLSFDRLDLDGLAPPPAAWAEALRTAPGFDANLRLSAETLSWAGLAAERAAVDAVVEGGRLGLRRLSGRIGGADVTLAGSVALGATPRFADIGLEVAAPSVNGLAAVLAPVLPVPEGLQPLPLRLRVTGGGPADALALAGEGELGELRAEGQSTTNLTQGRASGSLTLRHPGAPRLALLLGAPEPPAWLGEGSFSLIATLSGGVAGVSAESLELVAGGLRARGQLALALDGVRPRLTGRLAAERLPLPGLPLRGAEPLALGLLGKVDAELALTAAELASPDLPPLTEAAATLRLDAGRLALDEVRAGLGGGVLEGRIALDGAAAPPVLEGSLGLAGATLSGPLFGLPFDIASGRVEAQARFTAAGHAPTAMLATLAGEGRFAVADGVLVGVALGGASAAAALEDAAAAEAGVRAALEGGATALERLEGGWRAAGGVVSLEEVRIAGEGGVSGAVEGSVDLPRGALDLRFLVRPGPAEAPPIALRVTGPAETPRRQPEVAPWARWRAER